MKPGQGAVEKGYVERSHWKKAMKLVQQGDPRRIELILYQQGLLDNRKFVEVLTESLLQGPPSQHPHDRALLEDLLLSRLAVKRRWLSSAAADRLVRYLVEVQSQSHQPLRLTSLAKVEGLLSDEQIEALARDLAAKYFICPSCNQRIAVGKIKEGGRFQCPRCQSIYRRPPQGQPIQALQSQLVIPIPASCDPAGPTRSSDGRYQIRGQVDQGGIGEIHLAFDRDLQRMVAVKVLRQDKNFGKKTIRRFIDEARILAHLEHPNIVPAHEMGYSVDGRPYFIMKYVQGEALGEVMTRLRQEDEFTEIEYNLDRLLDIFRPVCQAMAFAHSQGVIHRDLKTPNIMLGAYGEVLVMDWGLAKWTKATEEESPYGQMINLNATSETSEGTMIGTIHYIPPEQLFNKPGTVDERSDTYALGAILYEMLCFLPPFIGGDKEKLKVKLLRDPPPLPSEVSSRLVPRELEAICMKALAKDPTERYQTAMALWQDVHNYRTNQPVTACPDTPLRSFVKWTKRNKFTLLLLGAVFTAILAMAPVLDFALRAAIVCAVVIASAVFAFVFYDEARREISRLKGQLEQTENARRQLEQELDESE